MCKCSELCAKDRTREGKGGRGGDGKCLIFNERKTGISYDFLLNVKSAG